ncbi:unnamed protein product [Citrullus colocynthis]|uniref:Uncharacterized protein n=1 Tax=Citrullus colocynthis TaxID=252529 RepID=A0ABP0ZD17_9ROSI
MGYGLESFIDGTSPQPPKFLEPQHVKSLLIAYEARLEKQTATDQLNFIQANLAHVSFGQNSCRAAWPSTSKSPTQFPIPQTNFSNPGMPTSFTSFPPSRSPRPSLGSQNWPSPQPSNRPQCQICNKLGHAALTCYNLDNPKYQITSNNPPPQAHLVHTSPAQGFSPQIEPHSTPNTIHPNENW